MDIIEYIMFVTGLDKPEVVRLFNRVRERFPDVPLSVLNRVWVSSLGVDVRLKM